MRAASPQTKSPPQTKPQFSIVIVTTDELVQPEAEAYLAQQDKDALDRGEFYLDGPEQDKAASDCTHLADGTHRI